MKEIKLDSAYEKIVITLKSYSDDNKISIKRARYALSVIHRFSRPFNTRIINELCKKEVIKANGPKGQLEILI